MEFQLVVKGTYLSKCGKYRIFQETGGRWKLFVFIKIKGKRRYIKYVSMEVTQTFYNPMQAKAFATRMEKPNGGELSDCNTGR